MAAGGGLPEGSFGSMVESLGRSLAPPMQPTGASYSEVYMIDYLKRAFRFFALSTMIPLIIGFTGDWSAGFGSLLFILGIPVALAALILGTIVWLVRGLNLPIPNTTKIKRAAAICISPLLFAATLMVSLPMLKAGSFLGSFTRLVVNHGHYETIIAKAQASSSPSSFEVDNGVTYSTDLGPPVRVAFNPEGILDNWSGIIYDPTGDVMLANGFDQKTGKFYGPARVTQLFGGYLVSCVRLWRDYYRCDFT